jgi:pyruvate,water dikinase
MPASVVHSPAEFERLAPGSLLVCPTTISAGTPLFGQASGPATDIGGVGVHRSIVAREHGIPAAKGAGLIILDPDRHHRA